MLTRLRNHRTDTEQGFTLLELLVVIVIIGILAAIAVPIFLNQQKTAIAATVKSDAHNTAINVRTALSKNPTAAGFTIIKSGETVTYAFISATIPTIVKTTNVTVPTGNVAVYIVQSKNNLTVITDHAHAGAQALSTLPNSTPNWHDWVIHTENTLTGNYYEYDSVTGISSGNINVTPVGNNYDPSTPATQDNTTNTNPANSGNTTNGTGSSTGGNTTNNNNNSGTVTPPAIIIAPAATYRLGNCYPNGTFSSKNLYLEFDNSQSNVPVTFSAEGTGTSVTVPANHSVEQEVSPMWNNGGGYNITANGSYLTHLDIPAFPNCF